MVCLIALISSGKGTWAQVNELIRVHNWQKVYLICNDFGFENFEVKNPNLVLKLKFDEKNFEKSISKLVMFFKKEIKDFEVCVNLNSGSGFEHMVVLTTILKSGLGLRFVYSEKGIFNEFKILDGNFEEEEL